jgi:hypothetical protein
LDESGDEIDLAGEMVVNACLADQHNGGDIGIAESIIAALEKEAFRTGKNIIGSG